MRDASPAPGPVADRDRIALLDVLRGFALLGIIVVNMEGYSTALAGGWGEFSGTANDVALWLVTSLAALKFYTLFALLFGYGVALQLGRAGDRDLFFGRYRRRLALLFSFGLLHAAFLYWGDILMLYAVVGLSLVPLSRLSDRQVLSRAAVVFSLGAGVIAILALALVLSGSVETDLEAIEQTRAAYVDGSAGDVFVQRFKDMAVGQAGVLIVQGPTVFAAFAVGLVLGRRGILTRAGRHRRLMRRTLAVGLPVGLIGGAVAALLDPTGGSAVSGVGVLLLFLAAPPLTAAYVAAFALIPRTVTAAPAFAILRAPGRMSLSVYLLGSLAAAFIFTSLGLGLFQRIDAAEGLALALAIWLGLALAALAWMRIFRFGPFEWLLRSYTYGRLQPMRREPGDGATHRP